MSHSGEQFTEGSQSNSNNLRRRGLHSICSALSEKLNGESISRLELNPATMNLGSVEGRVITSVSHGTANAPVVLAAALSNIAEHSYAAKPTAAAASNGSKEKGISNNSEDPSSSSSSDSSSSDSETEEVATKDVASGPAKTIITVAPPVTEGIKSSPRLRSQPVKYVDEMQKFQAGSSKGTTTPTTQQKTATPKAGSTSKGRTPKSARQNQAGDAEKKKSADGEPKRRGRGCGKCEGCQRADCGNCTFCKDKPKFGGPGIKKQRCALRACLNFVKKPNMSGLVRSSAASAADSATTTNSVTVDLRAFVGKTPTTARAGTTPTSAVTTPIASITATPSTAQQTQSSKVVAKVIAKSSSVSSPKPATPASKTATGAAKPATPSAKPSTSAAANKTSTPVAKATSSAVTPAQQASTSPKKGTIDALIGEMTMKCVQCGRERKIGMARTEKFCTQRCIINWLEANPDKNVEDAMGATSPIVPLSIASVQSLSTPLKGESQKDGKQKPVSRALKNLQIDMALPGTKLPLPNDEEDSDIDGESSEGRSRKKPRMAASPSSQLHQMQLPGVGTRATRKSQASPAKQAKLTMTTTPVAAKTAAKITTRKSTQSSNSVGGKATPASSTKSTTTPVSSSGNIKRMLSASAPHPPALKRAKTGGSGGGTPSKSSSSSGSVSKAVTFNLGFVQNSQSSQSPTPTFSLVPIDQLSAPLGGTLVNQPDPMLSIPDGLTSNVRSWSMEDVMEYFRSTSDCKDFCDIFAEQEVDGTALLLLTHEALVKCLGIKLGRAVKIMAHVEALKHYFEKSQ